MILKLQTVKDYCKKNGITDAAARKRINTNSVDSCIYKKQVYIIIEDNTDEKHKHKIKELNSKIKILQSEALLYTKQDDLIEQQRLKIEKLEARNEKLEDKLDDQVAKKEELYEKVIGHMALLENKV